MSSPVSVEIQNNLAVIAIDNPPVNALGQAVRQGLIDAIDEANAVAAVEAIVLHCCGRTFVAGADISEFGKPPMEPHLPDVLNHIEGSQKPVVVALHGTVLGGGLELALACHARVALTKTRLGLPEVTLGLIPGAGGTQRLPRVVGVKAALDIITSGKPISASAAFDSGLLSSAAVFDDIEALLSQAKQLATDMIASGPIRVSEMAVPELSDAEQVFAGFRETLAKKARGQSAPLAAVQSVENVLSLPFAEGVAAERELFLQCKASPQSRAMRHAFFAERSCAKVAGLSRDIKPKDIQQVGVIGAGTMGAGIAMCFSSAGIAVRLLELAPENLQRGLALIAERYQQSVERGRITAEVAQACVERINGTCEYADLADVDLVVEAAFENMQVKQEIFSTLESVCKPEAILASNTSYLDINTIAAATKRPSKVLGMHFFSPAHVMKLLEVVRTEHTDDQTLATVMKLGKQLGKIACAVGVCYGFVGNRMYSCYGREANALLLDGARPAQVDAAMRAWGMAMGPLAVTDMSGIDIGYKARRERPDPPQDPLYFRAADLMVENDRLGVKSSAGFYRYEDGKSQGDDDALVLLRNEAQQQGIAPRDIDDEEVQQRLILALINEGAHILQDGIAARASDIDVIWLNGYGFPRWRGGPMCYADELGLDAVIAQLLNLQQSAAPEHKHYWQPAPLLCELADTKASLSDYQRMS